MYRNAGFTSTPAGSQDTLFMQFDSQSFGKPQLILKYFRGEITPKEAEELNKWLQEDEGNRRLMNSLLDELELQKESRFFSSVNLEEGWEKVLGKLGQKKKRGLLKRILPADTLPEAGRQLLRWQVAATLAGILIAAWGMYHWVSKDRLPGDSSETAAYAVNDIVPGGDRARLTLADGTEITLDDAGEGVIREEDGIRISRQEGELTYKAESREPKAETYHTLSTPRGGQYRLVLPDGSKVWLNAASSIRFPRAFTGQQRLVEISGEVYFEIARDPDRPFRVKAADQTEVEVLGTHFNIMAYEEEASLQTTVLEGSVMVRTKSQEPRAKKLLKPGQQARTGRGMAEIKVLEVNPEAVVAWKNGLFRFHDDDIRTVMKQIVRWYDVKVHYEGEPPGTEFTGMISRKVNIRQVLNMLERTGGVRFRIEGRNIIVTK